MSPNRSFDGSSGLSGLVAPLNCHPNGPIDPPAVNSNVSSFNGGWTFLLPSSQCTNKHVDILNYNRIFFFLSFDSFDFRSRKTVHPSSFFHHLYKKYLVQNTSQMFGHIFSFDLKILYNVK